MQILVVGGGMFLGPAVIAAALERGHAVSVFNRGLSPAPLHRRVEHLVGDRNADLSAIQGPHWDIVFDTCAYTPDQVALLLDALGPRLGHYVYVSSGSVYADFSQPGVSETSPTRTVTAEELAFARALPVEARGRGTSYGRAYGALKSAGEAVAQERLGERVLIARPGLLVGPGDYTDRLTSWVRRIARGGPTLAPGDPGRPVQLIDVRDAARWMVQAAAEGVGGAFNVTGPAAPLTMGDLFEACRRVADSDASFAWVPDRDLLEAGFVPWNGIPLWIPEAITPVRHLLDVSVEKALAHKLAYRPLDETLADILRWDSARLRSPLEVGIKPEDEERILKARRTATRVEGRGSIAQSIARKE